MSRILAKRQAQTWQMVHEQHCYCHRDFRSSEARGTNSGNSVYPPCQVQSWAQYPGLTVRDGKRSEASLKLCEGRQHVSVVHH